MITFYRKKILPIFDNKLVYKVLTSHVALFVMTLIAAVFFHLEMPVVNLAFFAIILMIAVWFSRDMMPCFAPIMLCSMAMLEMYGHTISDYEFLWPVVMVIAIGLVMRPFIFRQKYHKGKMLPAIIAVALAVTLGGVGSILPKDYFTPLNMYYVLMLGVGMVIAYLYMTNYISVDNKHNATRVLSRVMLYVGLMGILMVFPVQLDALADKGSVVFVQWKNNVSTFLLMSMPFSFYYASRVDKYGVLFYLFGALQFLALMLVRSRGGIIFGVLIFVACVIANLIFNTRINRKISIVVTTVALIAAIVIASMYWQELMIHFGVVDVDPNEIRAKIFRIAADKFMEFPLFGSGLGYFGQYYAPAPGAMYWYHSTPFQVIGSLGMVGVVAYLYQLWVRLKVCAGRKSIFNVFGFLSFAAFELMALVNPGDFCPFPYVVSLTLILTVIEKGNSSKIEEIGLRHINSPPLYVVAK